MKIMRIAAAAAISISEGSAYTGENTIGHGIAANTHGTQTPDPVARHSGRGCPGPRAERSVSAEQADHPALRDGLGPGHVAVPAHPE
jgi:hypothetical protein